jgi:acetate kinase
MRVLVVNCGSSTLKFELTEVMDGAAHSGGRRLASGVIDSIGGRATIELRAEGRDAFQEVVDLTDHAEATRRVLGWMDAIGFPGAGRLDAVGHRVVHGGDRFVRPTIIDGQVLEAIDALSDLAPLHNEPSLNAIRAAREVLGVDIPMVAVFDTAFHRSMPERASGYAIPPALAEKHGVRRYGFHGIAHQYMTERYAAITGRTLDRAKIITLQLGNGCSATAVENGRSVDTSMGFTPLEGLMMGTRSGDVDPSLAGFLARKEGVDLEEVEGWLNRRSGLLGVSGRSGDMRKLLESEMEGDRRAALAVDMFCYRVRKQIGAYLAALGGAEAIIFGGGIGENAAAVRARICAGMEWCGLMLDPERNAAAIGSEALISADGAAIHLYVTPVDEAAIIASETIRCLRQRGRGA